MYAEEAKRNNRLVIITKTKNLVIWNYAETIKTTVPFYTCCFLVPVNLPFRSFQLLSSCFTVAFQCSSSRLYSSLKHMASTNSRHFTLFPARAFTFFHLSCKACCFPYIFQLYQNFLQILSFCFLVTFQLLSSCFPAASSYCFLLHCSLFCFRASTKSRHLILIPFYLQSARLLTERCCFLCSSDSLICFPVTFQLVPSGFPVASRQLIHKVASQLLFSTFKILSSRFPLLILLSQGINKKSTSDFVCCQRF